MANPQTQFKGLQNARMDVAVCTRGASVDTIPVKRPWSGHSFPVMRLPPKRSQLFQFNLSWLPWKPRSSFCPLPTLTTGVGFNTNIRNWPICFLGLSSPAVPLDTYFHSLCFWKSREFRDRIQAATLKASWFQTTDAREVLSKSHRCTPILPFFSSSGSFCFCFCFVF